jgi:hypothetical protein
VDEPENLVSESKITLGKKYVFDFVGETFLVSAWEANFTVFPSSPRAVEIIFCILFYLLRLDCNNLSDLPVLYTSEFFVNFQFYNTQLRPTQT